MPPKITTEPLLQEVVPNLQVPMGSVCVVHFLYIFFAYEILCLFFQNGDLPTQVQFIFLDWTESHGASFCFFHLQGHFP